MRWGEVDRLHAVPLEFQLNDLQKHSNDDKWRSTARALNTTTTTSI